MSDIYVHIRNLCTYKKRITLGNEYSHHGMGDFYVHIRNVLR